MPNNKSTEKRMRQDLKRRSRNRLRMAKVRETRKKFEELVNGKKVDEARTALSECYTALDRASRHNTISPNKAARLKSRLTRNLNSVAGA